jgi:hypothetical protein
MTLIFEPFGPCMSCLDERLNEMEAAAVDPGDRDGQRAQLP